MGGSDSKELEVQSPLAQDDGLLILLNKAAKQKEDEYKESYDKLNIKLDNVRLAQKAKYDLNADLLNLKLNKLQLKSKNCTKQYKSETNFIAAIRKMYMDEKEKLLAVENEKTIKVANLNLDIAGLNVNINNLKQQIKDGDDLHKAKEQQNFLESCEQKNAIAELEKKKEPTDLFYIRNAELNTYKQQINALKFEKQTLCNQYKEKVEELSEKNRNKEAMMINVRASSSNFNVSQSRLQQEIMCLKTENQQLIKRQQNDETKYKELLVKCQRKKQSSENLRKEISALNVVLTTTVKLTTLQQKGVCFEIKKSLQGLKVDLQFLIPNLNERTIPTLLEGNREVEKLNALIARNVGNLQRVIEYQSRFDSFVDAKQPMAGMEAIPNFLSGTELPCSFLHLKFLPLFRITFSAPIENNVPRPLLPSHQQKSRHFVPTFQNQSGGDNDSSEPTGQNTNANYRNRFRVAENRKRNPKQNKNQHFKTSNTADGHVSADGSGCEGSAGVTLTILTDASTIGAPQTVVQVKQFVEKTDCVICGESLKSPLMTVKIMEPCMHKYHTSCINEWFDSNTECPECAMED